MQTDSIMVSTTDGLKLAVYEFGNPQGAEIVLLHGFCQSYLAFEKQFSSEALQGFRIVAFDLRGHGASDKPLDAQYYRTGERWVDDLRAVLQAKQLKRPVLVGWSMGGRVIREYLVRHGDGDIAGVNFVGSQVVEDPRCLGPAAPPPFPATYSLKGGIAWATTFLRGCYHIAPSNEEFAFALAYNMMIPDEVRRAIRTWKPDIAQTMAGLAAVKKPVLLTHGKEDKVIPPLASEITQAQLQQSRISWYDCGHSPCAEDASRFNRELADFVRQVELGTFEGSRQ